MDLELAEFVDNPEPRCPVLLLLDTSDSMKGMPIEELNAGLAAFKYAVEQDSLAALRVELALVTFGGVAELAQDFKSIDQFTAPKLKAQGNTPLGHAMEIGLACLQRRKEIYKRMGVPYYRPWLFLITDGAPTDGMLWYEKAQEIQAADQSGKLSFYTIAVAGADIVILNQIATEDRPPFLLKDLRFRELFQWLSASIRSVSASKSIHNLASKSPMLALPPVSDWAIIEEEGNFAA